MTKTTAKIMGEKWIVEIDVDDDMVFWLLYRVDHTGIWEEVDRGISAVATDATHDAGIALRQFMPEWLR